MYADKSVLAIIPARGGSRGIPGKNIRLLAGKPLIAWTIEEAKKSRYIDRLILSSDDQEIISIARDFQCEVPFIRPAELARDDTPGIEPVLHAMEVLPEKYDYIVLLQPTSPLRKVEDIDSCIERCLGNNAPACVSVTAVSDNPYWMFILDMNMQMRPYLEFNDSHFRRQELPALYALNGAVYVGESGFLKAERSFVGSGTVAYPMPASRSADIDEEADFEFCEWMIGKQEQG